MTNVTLVLNVFLDAALIKNVPIRCNAMKCVKVTKIALKQEDAVVMASALNKLFVMEIRLLEIIVIIMMSA